jgi:hypothetical protein
MANEECTEASEQWTSVVHGSPFCDMAVKGNAMKRWIYRILWGVLWVTFVSWIPSNLNSPWNVFNMLLGFLSPYLWIKTLILTDRARLQYTNMFSESKGATPAITAAPWGYLIAGVVAWSVFVSNIPAHPLFPAYVLRDLFGGASPFLLMAARFFWRNSKLERGDKARSTLEKRMWLFFILGAVTWSMFVTEIPCAVYFPWRPLHIYFGSMSLSWLLWESYSNSSQKMGG